MRVLYVTSLSMGQRSGACEHVKKIAEGMTGEDIETRLVSAPLFEPGLTNAIKRKLEMARLVREAISDLSPDIIYLRYDGAEILSVLEIVRRKIPYVVELNSNILAEFWATQRFIPFIIERLTQPYVFSNAAGIAAVTREIYRQARPPIKDKPFLVAKNGVDINEIIYKGYDTTARKEWDTPEGAPLVIVIGSLALWHGVDLLLEAFAEKELEGFYLWIVGSMTEQFVKKYVRDKAILSRIRLIPWQEKKGLSNILSAADIGIGALALHRKQLAEAQALKVRTYLAAGVPTLLGYKDPAIEADRNFICYGTYDTVKDLASGIKMFYVSVKQNRARFGEEARRFAEEKLSWVMAAKETASFIKTVYGKGV